MSSSLNQSKLEHSFETYSVLGGNNFVSKELFGFTSLEFSSNCEWDGNLYGTHIVWLDVKPTSSGILIKPSSDLARLFSIATVSRYPDNLLVELKSWLHHCDYLLM